MAELLDLWREHRAARFPPEAYGFHAAAVDLVGLDGTIAGCVRSFLESGYRLDGDNMIALKRCRAELAASLEALPPQAKPYFVRLGKIAELLERNARTLGAG